MATLKDKFIKWKETRSTWQKSLDILFWVLLVLLIIPGPRKTIATQVNRLVLNLKGPGLLKEDKQVELTDIDYHWVLGTADSEPVFLSDLRDQVIFLNFWATWCPPCVAEMPEIEKAYQKHKNQVAFVLVTNEKPEVVKAFMEKHGYDLPVLYPGTEIPEVFQVGSLPTTFIISREGKIVARKTGAANWDSRATDRLFEELVR
ncbi:MAG: TlpA family protein disulfide reductase [Bacteroidales bacterium]